MRILIFGSTGLVGSHLLKELLANNNNIVAGCVRNRDNLNSCVLNKNLQVVDGDVLNPHDVVRAFTAIPSYESFDSVITCIGEELDCLNQVYLRGHQNILDAFRKSIINRDCYLIVGSGACIIDVPLQSSNWCMKKCMDDFPEEYKKTADEYLQVFNILKREFMNVMWTISCPPLIFDEEAGGRFYTEKNTQPCGLDHGIKAGNLAKIIVNELNEKNFVHERIGMCDDTKI